MADGLPSLTEPAPGGVCRVCERRLGPGSLECSYCGAVYGEANRCPVCRAVAGIDSRSGIGRCHVCGALRFALSDATVIRTGREAPLLRRAERARRAAVLRVTLGAIAGGAAFAALTATLLFIGLGQPGSVVAALGFVVAALALLAGAALASGARRMDRLRARTFEQARLLVVSDILASRKSLDAATLAELLRVDEATAELLLAEVQVNDFVHARVSDEGEIGFVPAPLAPAPVARTAVDAELDTAEAEKLHDASSRGSVD